MDKIYLIYENPEWSVALQQALAEQGLCYENWDLSQGRLNLADSPPPGVFFNRMSASSHTRDHRYSPEYTAAVLGWLETHGRRVINPGRALQLELSKAAQYLALNQYGMATPRSFAALGRDQILAASEAFKGPFIIKHNRAGKGLGVRLFYRSEELMAYLDGTEFEPSIDGITIVQEYIQAPEPFITRLEFIGREFLYAVRVDTSQGFELCPADACELDGPICATDSAAKFIIQSDFDHPLVSAYQDFMQAEGLDVAAFEFILNDQGQAFSYDINTNTNFNNAAETVAGVSGMQRLAQYLGRELARAV